MSHVQIHVVRLLVFVGLMLIASSDSALSQQAEAIRPLDLLVKTAKASDLWIRQNVVDYTATIVKRERRGGLLSGQEAFACKIRSRRSDQSGTVITPFSVYVKSLTPNKDAGRELIWVENQNNGKMIVHEAGPLNLLTFNMDPEGFVAKMGQRHSIREIGIENLAGQILRRSTLDQQNGNCSVHIEANEQFNGQPCTKFQVIHSVPDAADNVYAVEIQFSKENPLPLRLATYLWPSQPGQGALLDEEFIYTNVKLNVGLRDIDFDPTNPQYSFP